MSSLSLLVSPRLVYRPLSVENVAAFHVLATDEHVRRYLLDGEVVDRAWCDEQVAASERLLAERGLGIWLVERAGQEAASPIGFCGFICFPETGPEPQLLYALTAEHAGQGLATEMARTLIEHARASAKMSQIVSAVDEPNSASSRVLVKLGFELTGSSPGAFGRMLRYRLTL